MAGAVTPTRIYQADRGHLGIDWSDGRSDRLEVRRLRLACTCASCIHEWTGEALLDPASVPEDVRPQKIESVGLYGLRIAWSDGHGTGIYTYDRLRELGADAGRGGGSGR
jgi:ATP-binding protein involved in chromosome partitioning